MLEWLVNRFRLAERNKYNSDCVACFAFEHRVEQHNKVVVWNGASAITAQADLAHDVHAIPKHGWGVEEFLVDEQVARHRCWSKQTQSVKTVKDTRAWSLAIACELKNKFRIAAQMLSSIGYEHASGKVFLYPVYLARNNNQSMLPTVGSLRLISIRPFVRSFDSSFRLSVKSQSEIEKSEREREREREREKTCRGHYLLSKWNLKFL